MICPHSNHRYERRSTAEFVKEAMGKQGLKGSTQVTDREGGNRGEGTQEVSMTPHMTPHMSLPQREIITTRWANEDPNPTTIMAVKRSHMDAFQKVGDESFFLPFDCWGAQARP
jgi:hypothetical protein